MPRGRRGVQRGAAGEGDAASADGERGRRGEDADAAAAAAGDATSVNGGPVAADGGGRALVRTGGDGLSWRRGVGSP
jgi:hypothetical protein